MPATDSVALIVFTMDAQGSLLGSAFSDTLAGNAHANVLQGGDGDDGLWGYGGGGGNDTFVFNSGDFLFS